MDTGAAALLSATGRNTPYLYLLKVIGKDTVSRVGGVPARDQDAIPFPAASPRIPLARTVPTCSCHQLPRAAQAGLAGVPANGPAVSTNAIQPGSGMTAGLLVKSGVLTLPLGRRG